jgi:multidrug resistance efflux pump
MLATPQTRLATLVDPNKLSMEVHLPYAAASRIRPGQPVKVTVNTRGRRTLEAVVGFVSPTVRPGSQTVNVRADLTQGQGEVPSGIEGTMQIHLGGKRK